MYTYNVGSILHFSLIYRYVQNIGSKLDNKSKNWVPVEYSKIWLHKCHLLKTLYNQISQQIVQIEIEIYMTLEEIQKFFEIFIRTLNNINTDNLFYKHKLKQYMLMNWPTTTLNETTGKDKKNKLDVNEHPNLTLAQDVTESQLYKTPPIVNIIEKYKSKAWIQNNRRNIYKRFQQIYVNNVCIVTARNNLEFNDMLEKIKLLQVDRNQNMDILLWLEHIFEPVVPIEDETGILQIYICKYNKETIRTTNINRYNLLDNFILKQVCNKLKRNLEMQRESMYKHVKHMFEISMKQTILSLMNINERFDSHENQFVCVFNEQEEWKKEWNNKFKEMHSIDVNICKPSRVFMIINSSKSIIMRQLTKIQFDTGSKICKTRKQEKLNN